MRHLCLRTLLLLSAALCLNTSVEQLLCQPARKQATPASAAQLQASRHELVLTLPLAGPSQKTQAHVEVQLLNPESIVRAQLTQVLQLAARQRKVTIRLPEPFAKVPPEEMQNLHWMRLRYNVRSAAGDPLVSGIEALHAPETNPIVLTAAAGRVAAAGKPYRVQVHVKSNEGAPMSSVDVRAKLAWDDESAGEKKIDAQSTTNTAGNATLEFAIPPQVNAEDGDLTVSARNGLVVRSVEKNIYFQTPSFLLFDTDKDIYQPGQTIHARMLRFDSARKAAANDSLEVRITDEQNTLVFKDTVVTDAFGVAHTDWKVPDNILQGNYQIRATLSGHEDDWRTGHALKSVHIYRYDLPNFRVSAKPDKTYYLPGQNAEVKVSAEYLFGKPVTHAKVRVVEESDRSWDFRQQKWDVKEGQVETGELDRDGSFTARFDLSRFHKELADTSYSQFHDEDLAAYVTDLTTGRTEQRRFRLRVTREPIHVYLSDAYSLSYNQKMPPTFYVSTFYADGAPARCKVQLSLSVDDDEDEKRKELKDLPLRTVETNKYGLARVAELRIRADEDRDSLRVEVRDSKGLSGHAVEDISSRDDELGLVEVTTSRTIHKPGDPIEVTLRSSRPNLRLMVQVVREGVVLAAQQAKLRDGRSFLVFPYDPRFTDEVSVFAFSLQEEWSPTVLLEAERTVLYPKNRQLEVGLRVDKNEHRPGEAGTVRFAVQSADKTAAESTLGIKVVDQAVEERAQTDSDFGQGYGWGWWRWSLWSSSFDSFAGISRGDLDRIDLSVPIPADLDLVAEFLLRSSSRDLLELLDDRSDLSAEVAFSKLIEKQFAPVESGLTGWNQAGKTPRDVTELQAVAAEKGVTLTDLVDPWETPYRYELQYEGGHHTLRVKSAGPDKRFGTADDFTAHSSRRDYFAHYGEILDQACHDLLTREGRFIRDHAQLQAELLKHGLDFDGLRDPWGNPYETRFQTVGSYYVINVATRGDPSVPQKERSETVVWNHSDDYFAASREHINKVLTAHLNAGGTYPDNEQTFKEVVRHAGVDLDQLHDPWGNKYYFVFRKMAQYSDRIRIQRTSTGGQREGEPVTLVRQDVSVMSAGPDRKQGTADDFQIANYSMLVSEQSAQELKPRPAPSTTNLVGGTGAISGVVVDPTGAVIGNATVEAAREGTDEKHATKTDVLGRFEFKDLPPGAYDVRAYASGFRSLEVKAVPVETASITELSFALSLGTTTETVEVSAASVSVETSASMSAVAINGVNFGTLVKLSPGFVNVVTKSGAMSTPRLRQDFPETMLWEPALVTDRRGHAKLNFKFADNITTWKLTAVASTKTGELGRAEKDLRAFQPFFVEHDPPRILTQGDEIDYPLVLRNYLDRPQTLRAWIKPEPWFTLLGPAEVPVKVDAGDAARAIFRYRTVAAVTDGAQQVSAANADVSDAAQKPIDVHPFGRPVSVTASEIVDRQGSLAMQIPENAIPGSIHARVKVYPNLLAHVAENLEAGLQKPHGCGEQTISSTYPSLLVAEIYSKEEKKPAVALKAQRYLSAGYERLLRYQSEAGGFTYWGHGDPDLSLTAYAVEFLRHAATLIAVDDGVPQRAEQWLLHQQKPDGSWRRWNGEDDREALMTTAYIAGTLRQAGDVDSQKQSDRRTALTKALAFLSAHRDLADEPYVMATFALAAQTAGDQKMTASLVDALRKNAHVEGNGVYWALERNTPFYGWGRTGRLESTALAIRVLASIPNRDQADENLIRQGLLFLLHNEDKDGMWYCGQTTVHVLKTMLSLVEMRPRAANAALEVRVNGREVQKLDLPANQIVVAPLIVDVGAFVTPGRNTVELDAASEGMMTAQFIADSYVPWTDDASLTSNPDPRAASALRFSVAYSNAQTTTDQQVECSVRAERLGYRGYGMMLAEVGLPPGADVDRESLESALQGNYAVYRYDVLPDRVILYVWPQAGGSTFSFRFRPRFAMQAETAPSILYDYYNPDASVTLKPTSFTVAQGNGQLEKIAAERPAKH